MKKFFDLVVRLSYITWGIICLNLAFPELVFNIIAPTQELNYAALLQHINQKQVEHIILYSDGSDAEIYLKDDKTRYIATIPNEEIFCEYLQENISAQTDLEIDKNVKSGLFIRCVCSVAGFTLIQMGFRKKKDKTQNEASSFKDLKDMLDIGTDYSKKFRKSDTHFSDVAGLKEEKQELMEIIEFIKDPDQYTSIGAKIPRGVILSGPPGTGKTLLAKAVAGEAEVSFLAISGSEFDDKYVGTGATRVRKLFEEAKKHEPCIIFIDEIDTLGKKRNSSENRWSTQTIEQLLIEMDGFDSKKNVVVIAATNNLDILDPALVRPGRFDRNIQVNLPDINDREEILKVHGRNKKFTDDVSFAAIAHNTAGFSGAELENLLNEAALMAIRKKEKVITMQSIDEALKKITIGLNKNGRKISESERKLTAYHEAGHAVVSKFMTNQYNAVKEVSIIPRGHAGGYTWYETVEDKSYISKTELTEKLTTLLGGRAAESIALNDISTGASNDLQVATQIAKNMICAYGMNQEVGPISLVSTNNQWDNFVGSETMDIVVNLISESVKKAEDKAISILTEHRPLLDLVANALLEKETISGTELDEIFKAYQNTHAANV